MGRSSNKRGPDFRVLRPDLESSRTACDKPVSQFDLADWEVDDEILVPEDSPEVKALISWRDPELERALEILEKIVTV